MKYLVSAMLIVVGVIHLLPLSGVLGSERLTSLIVYAAFRPAYQTIAFVGGFISVLSFLYLAWSVGGYNGQVGRVFRADVVALGCLVVGSAAHIFLQREV